MLNEYGLLMVALLLRPALMIPLAVVSVWYERALQKRLPQRLPLIGGLWALEKCNKEGWDLHVPRHQFVEHHRLLLPNVLVLPMADATASHALSWMSCAMALGQTRAVRGAGMVLSVLRWADRLSDVGLYCLLVNLAVQSPQLHDVGLVLLITGVLGGLARSAIEAIALRFARAWLAQDERLVPVERQRTLRLKQFGVATGLVRVVASAVVVALWSQLDHVYVGPPNEGAELGTLSMVAVVVMTGVLGLRALWVLFRVVIPGSNELRGRRPEDVTEDVWERTRRQWVHTRRLWRQVAKFTFEVGAVAVLLLLTWDVGQGTLFHTTLLLAASPIIAILSLGTVLLGGISLLGAVILEQYTSLRPLEALSKLTDDHDTSAAKAARSAQIQRLRDACDPAASPLTLRLTRLVELGFVPYLVALYATMS